MKVNNDYLCITSGGSEKLKDTGCVSFRHGRFKYDYPILSFEERIFINNT